MRKLFSLLLSVFLMSTGVAFATSPIDNLPQREGEEAVVEVLADPMAQDAPPPEIKTVPMTSKIDKASDIKPYDEKNLPKENLPEPKSELRRLSFMFLKVMAAVAICSVLLYFILLFVRRFYSEQIGLQSQDEAKDSLKSSQSEAEALKTFLNKTKNQ